MLTASWQYKDKVNPKKKTRTGGNVTKAQGTFNAMDVTQRKINLLDIPALSPEEKLNFIIALENMKQAIEAVLVAACLFLHRRPQESTADNRRICLNSKNRTGMLRKLRF
jgi:hypothetical protein